MRSLAFYGWIRENGNQYEPALLEPDMFSGDVGTCFDSSLLAAMKNPEYRYVEGIAEDPWNPGRWILHAWVTDGKKAYDPTWVAYDKEGRPIPVPTTYIGIEMPTHAVVRFVQATGYQGVFANGWRDPRRALECYPNTIITTKVSKEHHANAC